MTATRPHNIAVISDDDEFFRLALRSLLQDRLGFSTIVETASFDEAIEFLAQNDKVDLALFDLNMPGMDSRVGLRTVRECFPDLWFAVISASKRRRDLFMALQEGARGYVDKGAGISGLGKALGLICEGSVYVPGWLPETAAEREDGEMLLAEHDLKELDKITPRQREVLQMLVQGKSNKEMARDMQLSEGAIKFHLSSIFTRLGAKNRVEAATVGARLLGRGPEL